MGSRPRPGGTLEHLPGPPTLSIRRSTCDSGVRLLLEGELDLATASDLEAELEAVEADRPPLLVIDLRGLRFMDSSGVRCLLAARERARAEQRKVTVEPGDRSRRILEVLGLLDELDIP